jgi:hypothetical protein
MSLRKFQITLEGVKPLICGNPCTVDTLGKEAQAKKWYTDLKSKEEIHLLALRKLDWLFSGYWDKEGDYVYGDELKGDADFEGFMNPCLPAQHLQRCLRDGATLWKKGKDTKRSIIVEADSLIEYDGPKDAREMYEHSRFISSARTNRGTITVRLKIPEWRVHYSLLLNDEILNPKMLEKILHHAGMAEGLGTWRPSHGRFQLVELQEVELENV